jgi:hypothetical protein
MERRVPFADNAHLFHQAGLTLEYAEDRIHPGLRTRVLEGKAIASAILQASPEAVRSTSAPR